VIYAEVAKAGEVNANVLRRWRREIQEFGVKAFCRYRIAEGRRERGGGTVAEGGPSALEIEFLRRFLRQAEEHRKLPALNIRRSSMRTTELNRTTDSSGAG
jgi:transposase-like protein